MILNANDLILFAHIMEYGSFSAASDHTGLPKSTLSRRISDLETLLGEKLITRSTRKLAITDFGEAVLQHAKRLLEETEAASAFALNRQTTPQGKLRVSLPTEFKEFAMVSFLEKFTRQYPQVSLELDLSARRVDLIVERFDIAIRIAPSLPDDSTLVARKIAVLKNGLYANPLYLKKNGTPSSPEDLIKHQGMVLINSRGDFLCWKLHNGQEEWEGLPLHRISSNSVGLHQDLAAQGMGIVGLSELFARPFEKDGRLVRILPEWSMPTDTVWCVTPGRRLLPTRTQAFIDLFKQEMQDA
ncbi:LysR family transcriptional regulator [Advenella sp. RU8]|uniref:LysR family transcriptional regulator n=1 Tax=Advenella sp. RU8 TaxID=3399575 RepID=UPI003AAC1FF3